MEQQAYINNVILYKFHALYFEKNTYYSVLISRSEAEWILRKSGKDFVPTDEDLNPAAWLDELKIARHPVSCDPVAKDHQAGFVSKIDQHYE